MMDAPEPITRSPAIRVQAVIGAFLQNAALRSVLVIALFGALILSTMSRTPARARPGPSAPSADPLPNAVMDVGISRGSAQPPEAVALDNLLSRFDQLIRLLEARAVSGDEDSARALADLRSLRASVFEASRRAITTAAPHPVTRR